MQFLCVIISFMIIGLQSEENVDVDEDTLALNGGHTWQYLAVYIES